MIVIPSSDPAHTCHPQLSTVHTSLLCAIYIPLSRWVLSSLEIIGRSHWLDKPALTTFILAAQDEETGGFAGTESIKQTVPNTPLWLPLPCNTAAHFKVLNRLFRAVCMLLPITLLSQYSRFYASPKSGSIGGLTVVRKPDC